MRTTLAIDDDVLMAAKELARRQGVSAGQVVSQLLRRTLTGQVEQGPPRSVGGFRPFPAGKAVVTNDAIDRLREREGV